MAAIASVARDFHTNQYETFRNEVKNRLGNDAVIKSWQVFNRCIIEPSGKEKGYGYQLNHHFLTLPAGDQKLQQRLVARAEKVIRFKPIKESSPASRQITDEQIAIEIIELPIESTLRQKLIDVSLNNDPNAPNFIAQSPQEVDFIAAMAPLLCKPTLNKKDLEEKEDRLQVKLFLLPLESPILQKFLAIIRADFAAEIPERLEEFQAACEEILTPDPAEYPGGDHPIEHFATVKYGNKNSLDTLLTITYQRTFGN